MERIEPELGQVLAHQAKVDLRANKEAGASREEVVSAILVGLPAAGNSVIQVLPTAIAAYDAE